MFFTQPTDTKVFRDKIYNRLSKPIIRDKILTGNLQWNECDNKDVYVFLKLLKKPQNIINSYPNQISEEMLVTAVKKSKKQSTSSIFSGCTYAVYKYAILHERMLIILLLFYNMILKQRYCLNRWLKILEIYIKKGKGPRLGKLRNLQLIKGDLQIMIRMFLYSEEKEIIEKDPRISKVNYSSHKNYSIETAILEKRLVFDSSMINMENTIYTLTDLKACYDQ